VYRAGACILASAGFDYMVHAGYDSIELVEALKAAHIKGDIRAGLDMEKACVGNMQELGIVESQQLKMQARDQAYHPPPS
jgi:chaperonin GroEL (HSP60 family)